MNQKYTLVSVGECFVAIFFCSCCLLFLLLLFVAPPPDDLQEGGRGVGLHPGVAELRELLVVRLGVVAQGHWGRGELATYCKDKTNITTVFEVLSLLQN